jgi:hypothetical protein
MTAPPRDHARLFSEWGAWADVIGGQLWLLRSHEYLWSNVRDALVEHQPERDGTFLAHYCRVYADAQLMTLRRLAEPSNNKRNRSLTNLLRAIKSNPHVLTLDRFRALPVIYPSEPVSWFGDVPPGQHQNLAAIFNGTYGDGDGNLSVARVDADLATLTDAFAKVATRATHVIAHLDRRGYFSDVKDALTYADLGDGDRHRRHARGQVGLRASWRLACHLGAPLPQRLARAVTSAGLPALVAGITRQGERPPPPTRSRSMGTAARGADETPYRPRRIAFRPVNALAAALVGLAAGAWLTSFFSHRQWLREQRLTEYAELLNAFRAAVEASARAIQAPSVVRALQGAEQQEMTKALPGFVRDAWDKGDAFLAVLNRVRMIASTDAQTKAEALGVFVVERRKVKPLSPDTNAPEVAVNDFPKINRDATIRIEDFVGVASEDVVRIKLRVGR